MIRKVGNILKNAKRIFDHLLSQKTVYCSCWIDRGSYLDIETKKIFNYKKFDLRRVSSWYTSSVHESECTNWHLDGHFEPYMLLCAYPTPTQILKILDKDLYLSVGGCSRPNNDLFDEVDRLEKEQKVKIFIPKPGDVYLLSVRDTIHRTDPNAWNKPRLILRANGYVKNPK